MRTIPMQYCSQKYRSSPQSGYIAIMTALVTSALLLILGVSISTHGYHTRDGLQRVLEKEQSVELAMACARIASLEIVRSEFFAGNATTTFDGVSCHIGGVQASGLHRLVSTSGYFGSTRTFLTSTIRQSDGVILSVREKTSY
jgi:hypothetical protein